jgi:hypothetical protein
MALLSSPNASLDNTSKVSANASYDSHRTQTVAKSNIVVCISADIFNAVFL